MEPTTAPTAPVAPAPVPVVTTVERSQPTGERESTILAFAASAGLSATEATQLVDSGRSAQEIGRELLTKLEARAAKESTPQPAVDLSEREQKQFSITRALKQS